MQIKKNSYTILFISLILLILVNPLQAQQGGDFSTTIQKADSYFLQKDYYNAKSTYELALKIKPSDEHASQRITEIIAILKSQMGVQGEYDEHISQADEAMILRDYATAITHYQQASSILPQEQYPKTQLQKAQVQQAAAEEKKAEYEKAIQQGDIAFGKGDYPNALLFFKHAVTVDDTKDYPKEQINKIQALIQQQANAAQNYETAIRQGDQQFNYMKYNEALLSYQQALAVKTQDDYAKQQIAKTKVLVEKEQTYDGITAEGDKLYTEQKYKAAIAKYEKARQILPQKPYAPSMIAKVKAAMQKQAEVYAAQEADYKSIVQAADKLMIERKYEQAIIKYQEALAMRPEEDYPQQQIEKAKGLLQKHAKYLELIAAGDKKYEAQDYDNALYDYYAAKNLKPNETYPQQKIEEIDAIINKQKALSTQYKQYVGSADSLFQLDSLQMAQTKYQSALKLKPAETYPLTKIEEIKSLIAEREAKQKAYNTVITKADKFFNANKFFKARAAYREALEILPSAPYPKYKIEDINTIEEQGRQQKTQADYDKLIAQADAAFQKKLYTEALSSYESAQKIRTEEPYPSQQITKINEILEAMAQADRRYNDLVAEADVAFNKKEYQLSLDKYTAAHQLKTEEPYPPKRMKAIEGILADLQKSEAAYQSLIVKGDVAFLDTKYSSALEHYQSALQLKPNETYPQQKIDEIKALLADEQQDEAYKALIAEADKHFEKEKWRDAIGKYTEALRIKPNATYPQSQIALIEEQLTNAANKQQSYDDFIAKADSLFKLQEYQSALGNYQSAHQLKIEEPYPPKRMKAIEGILADLQKSEAAYQSLIVKGDAAFLGTKYSSALEYYQSALQLKPNETYPQQKIDEIKALLADEQQDEAYKALIAEADKHFEKEKWRDAIGKYTEALGIKPNATYPQSQIALIEEQLTNAANKQQSYDDFIAKADSLFKLQEYQSALGNYQSAHQLKTEEPYPLKRMKAIEGILADLQKSEAAYLTLIQEADALFKQEAYQEALTSYISAADMKPNEDYPKTQIAKINTLLGKEKEYLKLIAKADKALVAKQYTSALDSYKKALGIKPNEGYPKEKIAHIESVLQSAAALEEAYAKAIAQGDATFEQAKYPAAQKAYTQALDLKPEEAYPKQQLALIAQKIKAQEVLNKAYEKYIVEADAYFRSADWPSAQVAYRSALELKPREAYPKQQLELIVQKLQSIADKQATYEAHIAQGDTAMLHSDYQQAINSYKAAIRLFDKVYPHQRIAEAEAALKRLQAEADMRYKAAVAEGNRYFKRKQWDNAIAAYQQALGIMPQAVYPQDKIDEIERIQQAKHEALLSVYNQWVKKGDDACQGKAYQEAIHCYREALHLLPEEEYPQQQIDMIMVLLDKASNVVLLDKEIKLKAGQTKRFDFTEVPFKDRDNSYILIEIQHQDTTAKHTPKMKLDFGKGEQSSGGFSFNLYTGNDYHFYFINLGQQSKWQTQANNFIKILSEKQAIKVKTVKIGRFR